MRKSLLLLLVAMIMPALAWADNMAWTKTQRSSSTTLTEERLWIDSDVVGGNKVEAQASNDYSIGAWVNLSSYFSVTKLSGTNIVIFGYGGREHCNDNGCWNLCANATGGLIINGWGHKLSTTTFGGTLETGAWHHLLLTVSNTGKAMSLYLDGTLVQTLSMSSAHEWFTNEHAAFYFGGWGFGGSIDDVAFYNKALSADEAAKASKGALKADGCVAYFPMDEVAAGTTGQFANAATNGVEFPLNVETCTASSTSNIWGNGMVYLIDGAGSVAETAPTLGEGRPALEAVFTVPSASDYEHIANLVFTDANGNVLAAGTEVTLETGAVIKIDVTPETGYTISSITVGGTGVANGGTFTLMTDLDKSGITIGVAAGSHALTIQNSANLAYTLTDNLGNTISDLSQIAEGTALRLTVTVSDDVVFNGVQFDGATLTSSSSTNKIYNFTMPAADATLTIDARVKAKYTVTFQQPTGGTVSATYTSGSDTSASTVTLTSGAQVNEGTVITLVATAASGYTFVNFIVDGSTYAGTTYTVNSNVTVSATFEEGVEYCYAAGTSTNTNGRGITSLTVTDDQSNSATIAGGTTSSGRPIYYDQSATEFTTAPGAVVTVKLNGSGNWMSNYLYVDYDRNGTFDFTAANCTGANVDGELVSHTGYSGSSTDPSLNSDGTSINWNSAFNCTMPTFTIPSDIKPGKYRIRLKNDWNDTDPCGRTTEGGYTSNLITANGGQMIDFTIVIPSQELASPRTVAVATENEDYGTVAITDPATSDASISSTQPVVTVKATPATGYSFLNWTNAAGNVVSTTATYQYDGETDVTLTAHFGFAVSFSQPAEGGTIALTANGATLSDGAVVAPGTEITITATLTGDLFFTSVNINGTNYNVSGTTYTFTPQANTVVTPTFSEKLFTLTWTVVGNGKINVYNTDDALDNGDYTEPASGALESGCPLANMMWAYPHPDEGENIMAMIADNGVTTDYNMIDNGDYSDEGDASVIAFGYLNGDDDFWRVGDVHFTVTFSENTSAIEDLFFDKAEGPVEYYNLQGVRVSSENLAPGVYIMRQGKKVAKVLVRK